MSGWSGSTRRFRLPSNWYSELVPETFAHFGDICHVCGLPGADQVDHVIPGDDHSFENRRPIHGPNTVQRCHVYKSSSEGGKAAQAKRPKRKRAEEPHPGLRCDSSGEDVSPKEKAPTQVVVRRSGKTKISR